MFSFLTNDVAYTFSLQLQILLLLLLLSEVTNVVVLGKGSTRVRPKNPAAGTGSNNHRAKNSRGPTGGGATGGGATVGGRGGVGWSGKKYQEDVLQQQEEQLRELGNYTFRAASEEERLLMFLFREYDPVARAVSSDEQKTVIVSIDFVLLRIHGLDEISQVLTTTGLLIAEWKDERLSWSPEYFGNLSSIIVTAEQIWLPELAVMNGAEELMPDFDRIRVLLHHDGRLHWEPGGIFRTTCDLNIAFFPFDTQHCVLLIGAYSYYSSKMNITNLSDNIHTHDFRVNGEWEVYRTGAHWNITILSNNSSSNDNNLIISHPGDTDGYSHVVFSLHLKRRYKFYIMNIVLPCVMLSILIMIGFCLPPDAGEKISLGISVLLAFTVFLVMIADNIPRTSLEIPIIVTYLMATMTLGTLSVCTTVLVLNVHHRRSARVPPTVRRLVLVYLARLVCHNTSYERMCGPRHPSSPVSPSPSPSLSRRTRPRRQADEVWRRKRSAFTREHSQTLYHRVKLLPPDDDYYPHPSHQHPPLTSHQRQSHDQLRDQDDVDDDHESHGVTIISNHVTSIPPLPKRITGPKSAPSPASPPAPAKPIRTNGLESGPGQIGREDVWGDGGERRRGWRDGRVTGVWCGKNMEGYCSDVSPVLLDGRNRLSGRGGPGCSRQVGQKSMTISSDWEKSFVERPSNKSQGTEEAKGWRTGVREKRGTKEGLERTEGIEWREGVEGTRTRRRRDGVCSECQGEEEEREGDWGGGRRGGGMCRRKKGGSEEWREIAQVLDRFFFWLLFTLMTVSALIILLYPKYIGNEQ